MLNIQNDNVANKEKMQMSVLFLGLYFLLLPLDFFDIGNETSLLKFLSLLPLCAICFNFKNIKINVISSVSFLIYIFLNAMSIFYSKDADLSIQRTKSIILNYVMIIFCSTIRTTQKEKKFLMWMVVASGFFAILTMFFSNEIYEGRIIMKIGESKQDPNYFCGYIMFATVFLLSCILSKHYKIISTILFVLIFTIVFLTGSRGGTIAIVIACFSLFYLDSKRQHFFSKIFLLVALAITLYILLMNVVPIEVRMRFDPTFTQNDGGAGRFRIWKDLWGDFNDFSLIQKMFGAGAATVKEYGLHGVVAHNLWLETLIELGYLGFFVQIVIYAYFMEKAFKMENKIYFSSMIGFLVMTFSMSLYTYKPIYCLFIMINIMSRSDAEEPMQQIQ